MRFLRKDNFSAAVLAACMLGLVLCPYPYLAIGALFSFPLAFSLLVFPPFLLGSGFLLWRFFSRPTAYVTKPLFLALEGISWIAVLVFLVLVSDFNLQTGFEGFGLSCTFYLLTSVCCLPVVLMRKTALEQRLTPLSNRVSMSVLLVVAVISGSAMIAYLLSPPAFI